MRWFRGDPPAKNGNAAADVSPAVRSLLQSRDAEIRRLQRTIDLYKEAERHKEGEIERVRDRLQRLIASLCRGEYQAQQLSGSSWGRLKGLGLLGLCDYVEQSVLAEYQRLETEVARQQAEIEVLKQQVQQLEAQLFAQATARDPNGTPPVPAVQAEGERPAGRPQAEAALPFEPQQPSGPTAIVQRTVEQLEDADRAGLREVAETGISRVGRLKMAERTRERLVALGLLDVTPVQLLPGRTGDMVVRLSPLGTAVAAALGVTPVDHEASRWEAYYGGDLVRGYLLAELADAWAEAVGYSTDFDPQQVRVVGEGGRVVTPHAVVRTPEGLSRHVWLFREQDDFAAVLADAAAATTDVWAVGTTREVCRAVQQAFTQLALSDRDLAGRAVVMWLASFDQALQRQFKPVPSGPAAAQRVRKGNKGGDQADGGTG